MNKEIPVPDPFSKEYEYFFPSKAWEEIKPVPPEENIFPAASEIDVKIPEQ